jgi:hypothetical protein
MTRAAAQRTLRRAFDRAFDAKEAAAAGPGPGPGPGAGPGAGAGVGAGVGAEVQLTLTADEFPAFCIAAVLQQQRQQQHVEPPVERVEDVEEALLRGAGVLCAAPGHAFEPWVLAVPLALLLVAGFSAIYTTVIISGSVPNDSAYARRESCDAVQAEGWALAATAKDRRGGAVRVKSI